ncbi:MAG: VWA domain-containing protein [Blastocatellia bacterium]|nr:VWA domain-containing protein [Blastocatellia bacterium]
MLKTVVTTLLLLLSLTTNSTSYLIQNPEDNIIKIETGLVVINATVTDNNGRFVANLKANDFLLTEDGQSRQIAHFSAEETPFAAAILIDASSSMRNKLSRAKVAAAQFMENMRPSDSTAVYGFNYKVYNLQEFTNVKDISPDIWEIESDGTTSLYDAMYKSLEDLNKRSEIRRAVIIISDGGDSSSKHTEKQALELAAKSSTSIYTIDITDLEDSRDSSKMIASGLLKNFAEKTGGQYIKTQGGKQLTEKLLEVSKELRSQYTLTFYPEKPQKGKNHKLALKVNRPNIQVRSRQSY